MVLARGFYRRYGKRCLDVLRAGCPLIALAPELVLVALCVRVFLGSPVLFRQERTGFKLWRFTILKFRTMTDARDETGALLPDTQRLTWFGRWLRRSSLDELPELWNILRGEMSL